MPVFYLEFDCIRKYSHDLLAVRLGINFFRRVLYQRGVKASLTLSPRNCMKTRPSVYSVTRFYWTSSEKVL